MKPSVYGLALFSLIGFTVCFTYLTSQRDRGNTIFGSEPLVGQPVQIRKTTPVKAASHSWHVEEPKHLGRLQLTNFLEPDLPEDIFFEHIQTPQERLRPKPIKHNSNHNIDTRPQSAPTQLVKSVPPLEPAHNPLNISINYPKVIQPRTYAEAVTLPALGTFNDFQFTDQIEELAGASPIRPGSRDCGTLIQNPNARPEYDRVKSVGMSRQLTNRTSVGVEYVYKDECFNNQIVAARTMNMPSDDGVNLRVNMRF